LVAAFELPALLRRQAREAVADLAMVRRDWDPATTRALSRPVLTYHLRKVAGLADADRLRLVPLRHGDVRLDALARRALSDLFVLREVFVHQIYRYPYERYGPVRRVLDLGSNIGMSPLYFSLRYPGAEVVCVEPVAENVIMLRRQAARNRDLRWRIEPVAVAGWAGPATLTVGDLLDRAGWDRVDVVKMDIAGAEEGVLLDATPDWLHRVGALALDIHAPYVGRAAIVTRLAEYGFRAAAPDGPHPAIFARSVYNGAAIH
jgi:hypothetical protein